MNAADRTSYQQFGVRLIAGIYLSIGIIGFIPIDALNPPSPHTLGTHYLLWHFAVNPLHNLIHVGLGVSGLWLARTATRVFLWGSIAGPLLLVLAVVGSAQAVVEGLPQDQLLLGLVPLNSAGHVFHLVTGGFGLYLGLVQRRRRTLPVG